MMPLFIKLLLCIMRIIVKEQYLQKIVAKSPLTMVKNPGLKKGLAKAARAGSSRSPLWKKGGIAFGPKPRDFGFEVPKKVRIAACVNL